MIAIYLQTCLIELNGYKRLQNQYQGFLQTPQLHFTIEELPYQSLEIIQSPKELSENFVMPHPIRLGQRMEAFMEVAISDEYEILAKNLQIIHNKRTLGEFDFIMQAKDFENPIHLEMVYKFYFLRPEFGGSWIDQLQGPNSKDHLKLKIQKLQSHQFPLLYRSEAQAYLDKLGLKAQNIQQVINFKAQIFIPHNYESNRLNSSFSKAVVGYFYKLNELEILDLNGNLFYIPYKNDWVAQPENTEHFESFKNFQQKISVILDEQRSVLFWLYSAETDEIYRHFASWW